MSPKSHKSRAEKIIERQPGHFEKVHPHYASGVRSALAKLAKT